MPEKTVETFEVKYLQILNEKGECDEQLMPKLSDDQIKQLYEQMVLVRTFDEKALKLQRQGRIGTYAPTKGQEAAQIGSAFALKKDDWMVPTFRENGALIVRGMPMTALLQYWAGDERGQHMPEGVNIFPINIPIATQIPHATGIAWAMKLKGEKNVTLAYGGDGATSEGDFHDGLNFAGVFQVPMILVIQNNGWAISLPRAKQTFAKTLAQKGIAYGISCIQVDGNDVFAMYKATLTAVDRARAGKGPTLIEAVTYRMGDHTTSDEAKRYRQEKEVEEWAKKDPIKRLEIYMEARKIGDKKYVDKIAKDATVQVEKAVEDMEKIPPPNPEDIFKYTFKEMPPQLQEQLDSLKEYMEAKGPHEPEKEVKKEGYIPHGEIHEEDKK